MGFPHTPLPRCLSLCPCHLEVLRPLPLPRCPSSSCSQAQLHIWAVPWPACPPLQW
uniref:Uncharacterized protein n=1 Tax=Equus asinus TaxID=9793 RepID=A0A9L0ILM1_EQUAS